MLTVLEAGMGFGVLAVVIGYLPMLYQAFSRREANISLDEWRDSPQSVHSAVHLFYPIHISSIVDTVISYAHL